MTKITKNITKLVAPLSLLIAMAIPASAYAQVPIPLALSQTGSISAVMGGIIRFILIVAFAIAFIMLLIGGIRWIMAGGDEKAVEKARGTITAALIGLVVVLIAFALIRVVETFFGLNIISNLTVPALSGAQTNPTQ